MHQGQRGEAYPGLHTTASLAYLESRTIHPDLGVQHVDLNDAAYVIHGRAAK